MGNHKIAFDKADDYVINENWHNVKETELRSDARGFCMRLKEKWEVTAFLLEPQAYFIGHSMTLLHAGFVHIF